MIRLTQPDDFAGRPGVAAFCVVDVTLEWSEPPITRRLLVPTSANLGWLHAVLQVAMGWRNEHLHAFRAGKIRMGDPAQDPDEFSSGSQVDENQVSLAECIDSGVKRLEYEYDFGDSWLHRLTLKRMTKAMVPVERLAICLAGVRACPPEDCGGAPGYMMLLEILRNPKHPEHRTMTKWIGRRFDPEAFSVNQTNRLLAQLPWPSVPPEKLQRILRSRNADGP